MKSHIDKLKNIDSSFLTKKNRKWIVNVTGHKIALKKSLFD